MRKSLIILLMLFLISPLIPQERTGNIYGKVVDNEGNPLPGVTVTLTGSLTAPMYAVTSNQGNFRFLSLSPAKDYCIKAEIEGFKSIIEENCAVSVGTNVSISLTMEVGGIEEAVTVTASVPTVDMKKTSIGRVVTQEILQSLPSARDPWVVLQMSPGVQVDRENVGGSESGQQASFVGSGADNDMNNVWTMDGAVITDTKSAASAMYYDFDSFEEMTISVGGNDITVQTGGVVINMITRRGGNKVSLGGRFYLTDEKFQSENLTDDLREDGVIGTNKIVNIKDYGFNFGGPIVRDKAWAWMSYGVQDIKGFLLNDAKSDALLANFNGKFNLQITPQNRLEMHLQSSQKELWGKYASYSYPLGDHQANLFHFGVPLVKIQDEHMFGDDLFVSAKLIYLGSGYAMKPIGNEDLEKIGIWDVGLQQFVMNYEWAGRSSPKYEGAFMARYFNEDLFGVSHEITAGFEYADRRNVNVREDRSWYEVNWNTPQLDFDGDGIPDINTDLVKFRNDRYPQQSHKILALAAYLSDTISIGNFNIIAGLRFDKQTPSILSYGVENSVHEDTSTWQNHITLETANAINNIFPAIQIPDIKPDYSWEVFSPRLALTWDVQGNGKTVAKLSLAQYGDYMWTKVCRDFDPLGTSAEIDFWWLDDNGNGITDLTELYWYDLDTYAPSRVFDSSGNFIGNFDEMQNQMWADYDPDNPQATTAPKVTRDESAKSTRVQEAIFTIEREVLPDLGVSLSLAFRKYDRFNWKLDYFPDIGKIASKSDYVQAGTVPSSVGGYDTGEAAGKPYYLLSADYGKTSLDYLTRQIDRNNKYYGLHLLFNKRLTNKWMLNGSFSLQHQASHYGDEGFVDPTNIWALEGQPYAMHAGSSGKIAAYVFSRWLIKVSGLYQFPFGISVATTFNAREGYIVPEYFNIRDLNAPNPRYQKNTVYIAKFGTERLPTFWNFNIKVEKLFHLGETGRIYLTVDIFNVFNTALINRRYDRNLGTYYPHDDSFVPNPTNFLANEVLNPRILRLGMRFQF